MWPQFDHSLIDRNGSIESMKKSIETSRPALRDDLADLLAHILRLANDFGIDLEQAYLDKIRLNLGRPWPVEQRGPEQGAPDRGEPREG
jgi:NTP pyrophosphatase (non-canonical NTP hydrolase)